MPALFVATCSTAIARSCLVRKRAFAGPSVRSYKEIKPYAIDIAPKIIKTYTRKELQGD